MKEFFNQVEKIKYYKEEKICLADFWGILLSVPELIIFLKVEFFNEILGELYEYMLGFIILGIILSIFLMFIALKVKITFIKKKSVCITKGKQYIGIISETLEDMDFFMNIFPYKKVYYFKVIYEVEGEEKTVTTPIILFDYKQLLSKEVIVYEDMDMNYVGGYQLENNNSPICNR